MNQKLEEMTHYLLKQLTKGGQQFSFGTIKEENKDNHSGKDIHLLYNEQNQAILLVPDKYTNTKQNKKRTIKHPHSFAKAYHLINNLSQGQCLPIFYKDGTNFFRSPFNEELKNPTKPSLKNYDWEDKHNMIVLSPEEIFAKDKQKGKIRTPAITYYQPESKLLEEMITSYKFNPATLQPPQWMIDQGFIPQNSKRLFLWEEQLQKPGPIRYNNHKIYNKNKQ